MSQFINDFDIIYICMGVLQLLHSGALLMDEAYTHNFALPSLIYFAGRSNTSPTEIRVEFSYWSQGGT
jgi:hypothetical protein